MESYSKNAEIGALETSTEKAVRRNRGWYVAQGVLFLIAGLVALIVPVVTVISVEIFLAVLLIISGIYQIIHGFTDRSGWLIFSGLLSLGVGLAMLLMPIAGAIALATVIAFFLLVDGIIEIILSIQMRFSARWGWLMASGILSILLGSLLLIGWPEQTLFMVGIFLGISFIFYGVAVLAVAASIGKRTTNTR